MPDALFEMLQPKRLTAIVDVGANPIDGDPPYKRMLAAGLCSVVGFEPQPDALAELVRRKGQHEHYLPYAIGDGQDHTLYICRAKGMSSLLRPDPANVALFNEFPMFAEVETKTNVSTRRLDDVEEIENMDFLKIDIQGGELDAFKSASRRLAEAVAVQTEVSFITLYEGQPGLGDVDVALRAKGFVPHCLAELKQWPIAPLVIDGNPRKPVRQLLEADLVYVRDFSRAANMTGEQWKHLALIAHHCYGSVDLALRAIHGAIEVGALPSAIAERYLSLLRTPQPVPITARLS
jgi:FkbM family methyltransferase